MKIAQYKTAYGSILIFEVSDYMEKESGHVRISDPVDVDFPQLSDEVVIAAQLNALDVHEREIRLDFQRALNRLNDERAKLRALTVQP